MTTTSRLVKMTTPGSLHLLMVSLVMIVVSRGHVHALLEEPPVDDTNAVNRRKTILLRGQHNHRHHQLQESEHDHSKMLDSDDLVGEDQGGGQIQTRIINGNDVNTNRYPFYSLMRGTFMCGAVLVGPSLVLSAAHCDNASTNFRVGAWDALDDGSLIEIDEEIVHPDYSPDRFSSDIMLFHLDKPSSNPFIQLQRTSVRDGQALTVIGFGDTDPTPATEISDQLKEVEVQYVSRSTCNDVYGAVTQDMICAAAPNADSCLGDSGGPLFLKGNTVDEDRLVGLVSWGRGCAEKGYPGVYTNIEFFYDWIIETVCLKWPDDSPEYMGCYTKVPTESPTLAPAGDESQPTTSDQPTITAQPTSELPIIELVSNTPLDGSLGHCQGNCDGDNSCIAGLVCYKWTSAAVSLQVPGCTDSPDVASDTNVCVNMTLAVEGPTNGSSVWWSSNFVNSP